MSELGEQTGRWTIMGKPRHSQGLAGGWSSHLRPGFMGSNHQGDGSSRHCMELEVGPISLQGL